MKSISPTQKQTILSMLDAGQSVHSIASTTSLNVSTISRIHSKECSELQKATGGHPPKLFSTNVQHAICLISFGKAENAVQVTKALTNIVNQPLSTSTVHRQLRKTGMKAVVKSKQSLLSAKHCKTCLDFAYTHKDWTLEDWKKVVWSDETKINHLGSDGHKCVEKGRGVGVQSIHSTISYFSLFGIHRLHATCSPHSSFSSSLIHSTGGKLYIPYYTIFLTDCI